jgi:hypothetical protein
MDGEGVIIIKGHYMSIHVWKYQNEIHHCN